MPRLHSSRTIARIAAALGVALLAAPGFASAEPCANPDPGPTQLTDSLGFVWDNDDQGAIRDGGGVDSYDTANRLSVTVGVSTVTYLTPDLNGCTREDAGREIVYPEQLANGLQVSRKLFVPGSGTAFARWLNVLRNPSGADITVDVALELGNLGSDGATKVTSSSSGDLVMTVADSWATTDDSLLAPLGALAGDPALTHVWQSTAPGVVTAATMPEAFETNEDIAQVHFTGVTVPAAGTVIIMTTGAQRFTTVQATDGTAAQLARGSAELFSGLSPQEQAQIINWKATVPPEADLDGVPDATDNCPSVANADQLDTDRDGVGNACDADDDGDGTADTTEVSRGTDSLKADTDADGVGDNTDACPTQAGLLANGCVDTVKPVTTVTTKTLLKRAAFKAGVRARAVCTESCAVQFELVGRTTGGRLNAIGDVVLASRRFPQGIVARSATLKVPARLVGSAKRFAIRLRVTTTDLSGNQTVVTRTIRVR